MDLDSYFSIGATSIDSAQNTFTNRTVELDAFAQALDAIAVSYPRAVEAVEDLTSPRRNVLTFYGVGGIGKTRLSRELETRYLAAPADGDAERLSHRVDFEAGSATDVEGLLLGLRAALGSYRPCWPAFDLGFAVYWERAHPGEAMRTVLNDSSSFRRIRRDVDLGSQLQKAIEELLSSAGGVLGIFTAGARLAGRSVRDRIRERRVLQECPFFERVVDEPDPAKMRIYLSVLLAWDLAQLQQKASRAGRSLALTVFFDTWERVQDGEPRLGSVEDLLSRLVWLMPTTLFVVSGRNRLRWADDESRARMQWAGPDRWPYLDEGAGRVEPRQHLVGGLSPEDSDRFLRLRLMRDAEPVLSPEVRQQIIRAAHGLPLYLDLAAVRYAQLLVSGRTPSPEEFGQPFPEIVLRLMADMSTPQRALLRMASLVGRFDLDLLLAGAPDLPDSEMSRFLRRSIVRHEPEEYLPYSLHETLRHAVRGADLAEDQWSDREWRRAAQQLTDEMHRRVDRHTGGDVSMLSTYFLQAFRLAPTLGGVEPWLWQLAARLQSLGALPTLALAGASLERGAPAQVAADVFAAVARRRERGPEPTARLLRRSLNDPELDEVGRQFATHWLAWMLDETGDWDDAEQLRLGLIARNGLFAPFVKHALGRSDWICGRLDRARGWEFALSDPRQRFWQTGIQGRVEWVLGRFAEAEDLYAQRLAAAEEFGSPQMVADVLRGRAQLLCFTDPAQTGPGLEAAEIYRRLRVPVSEAETRAALAVSTHVPGETASTLAELATCRASGAGVWADAGEVLVRCLEGDVEGAHEVRSRMATEQQGAAYGFWLAITGWWLDEASGQLEETDAPGVTWLHGADDARSRWQEVLRRRIPSR
ncbi:hypothetical protein [Cryptosporangium minutisporangium]|uniref:ATP/GTP-binding protein n=1 Tax=Cryptosporangium minutisporangium TaxID=113569 RepID=A0ABP6SS47_9ACTN